jgi:valyl-tRNA synthetase
MPNWDNERAEQEFTCLENIFKAVRILRAAVTLSPKIKPDVFIKFHKKSDE